MASLMDTLVDVLEKENSEYEGLVELSMKKTPIIVSGNLEKLREITDEEQVAIGRLQRLEKERTVATRDVANVINKDVETLKLVDLVQMMDNRPNEQKKLADLHDRLKDTMSRMIHTNDQNRELLKNALEMVKFDLDMIQAIKSAPETANYNSGAYSAGSTIGIDMRGFDAKQ